METNGPGRLRGWLREERMSQRMFAEALGITPETVSRYLNGRMAPTKLFALAVEAMTCGHVRREDWGAK